MKDTFFKSIMNNWRFKNETNLYQVEPIVMTTVCWGKLADVENEQKGSPLNFCDLKGMQLYAKLVMTQNKNYWELYIKNAKKICIKYVKSSDLNPVKMYKQ